MHGLNRVITLLNVSENVKQSLKQGAAQDAGRERFRRAIKQFDLTLLHLKSRNMPSTLGKRKRRDQTDGHEGDSGLATSTNTNHLQALFRQHFESNFEPLEGLAPQPKQFEDNQKARSFSLSESDWDGLSEDEEAEEDGRFAEVVHYSTRPSSRADVPKEELKTFMVRVSQITDCNRADKKLLKTAKPPFIITETASPAKKKHSQSVDLDEVGTEAANLQKDLALQRLLKESHLLDSQASLSHTGQNRHKALDLRLQDMGSKTSIFTQHKMPFAQRKGILSKSTERDNTRRQQAHENGIIFEKAVKGKSRDSSKRQRGIGAPSVGKFHGGMLKLSNKDVANIEGPKKNPRGRG